MFWLPAITFTAVLYAAFEPKGKLLVKVTSTDIAIGAYLLYGICNLTFVRDVPPDSLALHDWGMYLLLYLAARSIADQALLIRFIIWIGVAQAVVGLVQLSGWFPSNHSDFPVTGTFPNPGPYGGFLAVALTAAMRELRSGTEPKLLLRGVLLLLSIMLVVSDSRAAWIAAFIGIVIQLPRVWERGSTRMLAIIVAGLLAGGLYFFRPASADSRMLIWQVCAGLMKAEPVTGLGIGTLPRYYMNAQAAFFASHPDSEWADIANNNYQAFNEFIHVAVEQGAIGLLLLLGIIFTCRRSSCFPLILAWFTFSMFSYPADIRLLLGVLVLNLALCAPESADRNVKWNKKWLLCGLVVFPFTLTTSLSYNKAVQNIKSDAVAKFPYNQEYMLQFARQKQEIGVLKKLTEEICSSTDILCDLGDLYRQQGEIKRADSCYSLARRMVPCRMKPLHKLYLLYERQDSTIAKDYALQILNFKSHSVGSIVLRARTDARKFLNPE